MRTYMVKIDTTCAKINLYNLRLVINPQMYTYLLLHTLFNTVAFDGWTMVTWSVDAYSHRIKYLTLSLWLILMSNACASCQTPGTPRHHLRFINIFAFETV